MPTTDCFEAAIRLMEGEDLDALAREYRLTSREITRCRERLEVLVKRETKKAAHKELLEATREAWVEQEVRRHLKAQGYLVEARRRPTGPDILAVTGKDGRTLLVEVKGDRPGHVTSPGTINVDVLTLLGQIVMAKAGGAADDYAIAVGPTHIRLLMKAKSVLNVLGVSIMLVQEDGVRTVETL